MAMLRLMTRQIPPLAWFRAFESAARHLSFTAAAAELGVTQSAVSQNVRALEKQIDTMLFLRKARGLALTDAGRQLLPDISMAMSNISNAVSAFQTPSSDKLINIATSVSFAQWFLAPQLPKYQARFPDTRIRIITSLWPDDFVVSAADIEIRFGSKKHVGKNADRLDPDKLVLVASPKLAPSTHTPLDVKDFQNHPFIQTVGTANTIAYWEKKSGVELRVTPSLFADSYGLAVDFAKNGAGVALVSSLIAAPSIVEGSLIQIHPAAVEPIDGYYLAVDAKSDSLDTKNFTDWLKSYIKNVTTLSRNKL